MIGALCQQISDAAESGTPLEVAGGATRLSIGRPVGNAVRLSANGLSGVIDYKPGELTLVAGAGTPLAQVEAQLKNQGQQLTFEPPDYAALLNTDGAPTIGGTVALGASGPRRLRMGACRDALLGLNFIDGTGRLHRAGGRVMKNVTGYDLTRLQCGAFGTLGVITEIALKVMPIPEAEQTLCVSGLCVEEAVAKMAKVLALPVDLSGAAHLPTEVAHSLGYDGAITLLRLEGFPSQLEYRISRVREIIGEAKAIEDAPWSAIRDVTPFAADDRAVWRINLPPMHSVPFSEALRNKIAFDAYYDWAGGLIWLACEAGGDAHAAIIRDTLAAFGGHATLIRAPQELRAEIAVFHPEPEPMRRIAEGIKRKFDPAGILNPGRMRA